ncbi:hypothetical protein L1887_08266 [Cichorium endivia]|nr:hypothetical protein L1887_08266 [Cichorium endivia]
MNLVQKDCIFWSGKVITYYISTSYEGIFSRCFLPFSHLGSQKIFTLGDQNVRLTGPPPRLDEIGVSIDQFQEDTNTWNHRVMECWKNEICDTENFN